MMQVPAGSTGMMLAVPSPDGAAFAAGNDAVAPAAVGGSPETEAYQTLLSSNTGVMCYVEIPAISVTLPIRHTTSDEVLDVAIGHLEWSSLPVGGENTHCVLSGHRGLPSAELFTNLDNLEYGDIFYVHVLGETLEYWVDNISVVLPSDYNALSIVEGKDYVTLMTCTASGSNRFVVRCAEANGSGL